MENKQQLTTTEEKSWRECNFRLFQRSSSSLKLYTSLIHYGNRELTAQVPVDRLLQGWAECYVSKSSLNVNDVTIIFSFFTIFLDKSTRRCRLGIALYLNFPLQVLVRIGSSVA